MSDLVERLRYIALRSVSPNLSDYQRQTINEAATALEAASEPAPVGEFKPAVIYDEESRLTTILLRDTFTVWSPWGPFKGHAVEVGHDGETGELIGIQIWDDVRRSRKGEA